MKAIVWTKYGPPEGLQLREVEKPSPKRNELLIRIQATTVTAGDSELRRFKLSLLFWLILRLYMGLRKPRKMQILGMELAGEIEAVGTDVKHFRKGDQVFAATGFHFGAYAEYACLPSTSVMAIKPINMTYEETAAVPVGGLEALYFLRKGNIQRGQMVLINGAGGSIGSFAVQLARSFGAEVTGVDSTAKLDMLRSIGADHVIDYTQEDFTQSGKAYDVIFDVVGKSPFLHTIRSLKPNGRYLLANAGLFQMVRGLWTSRLSDKKVIMGASTNKAEDLIFLKGLIEVGTIKSVIDRCFPLEQIAEAHRYVDSGQKKGNIVITLAQDSRS